MNWNESADRHPPGLKELLERRHFVVVVSQLRAAKTSQASPAAGPSCVPQLSHFELQS